MAARVIGSGVVKSGSPMVRLMTSFISASMSKKRRIPDGGMARTRSFEEIGGDAADVGAGLSMEAEQCPRVTRGAARVALLRSRGAGHATEMGGTPELRRDLTRSTGEEQRSSRSSAL